MRRNFQLVALAVASLGLAATAHAQSSGSGTGTTGSSSPGTTSRNGSTSGVAIPGNAPVDNQTRQPAEPGTGEVPGDARSGGTGSGSAAMDETRSYTQPSGALVDLTKERPTSASERGTGSSSTSRSTKGPSKGLRDGLERLHAANQAEIESGRLAEQSAESPEVKAFGQQMVTDHTQNDQQLTELAQAMDLGLEGKAFREQQKEGQEVMRKVQGKTGADFDKAYTKAMVSDHAKDAQEVRKLAAQARKDGQAELASFLDQTEATIRGHLEHAKTLRSEERSARSSADTSATTGTAVGSSEATSR